jgi:hypothetical protein
MNLEPPMHILKTTIDHITEISERLRAADHVAFSDDELRALIPDFTLAAYAADILDGLAAHLSEAKGMLQ